MKNHSLYNIWDQVPVTYYQKGVKENVLQKIWHTHKINLAKKIILKLSFKNCLDVGCASGYMISEIARSFPDKEYYGIDAYDKVITHAQKIYPKIKFQMANAEKLPFKNNFFDLVISYETIEHVENPEAVLKEIRRILKQDGILILAMDSGNWLFRLVWHIWENSTGKVWQGAHIHPFHHNELENLISDSGFKINRKIFSHFGMEVVFILSK